MKELLEFMSEIRCVTGCDNVVISEDDAAITLRMDWYAREWHVEMQLKRSQIEHMRIDVVDAICINVNLAKQRDGIE